MKTEVANVAIPKTLHRKLRLRAVKTDQKMRYLVTQALDDYLTRIPLKEPMPVEKEENHG